MKKTIPKYITMKFIKINHKEELLKASRQKRCIVHRGTKLRMMAYSYWKKCKPAGNKQLYSIE